MADKFRTVKENGMGEIEEKKSRFIAHVFHIESDEEAVEYIAKMKKQYYDARHNCYAYVYGENREKAKSSDDGEPSGTAGKPILEVINGEGLTDVLIVVTRYFGGTLLGTGGLVRAYTDASKAGLFNSKLVYRQKGIELACKIGYTDEGKIRRYLSNKEYPLGEALYSDIVTVKTIIPVTEYEKARAELIEIFMGKIEIEEGNEVWT